MIRIVLAGDPDMGLGVIGTLLNLEEDIEVVGHAWGSEEAVTLVRHLEPDVCLIDYEMTTMNGFELAEALRPEGCRTIILTTFAKKGFTQKAVKTDVRGYLLKDSPSEDLVCSIRKIMDGEQVYSLELEDEEYREIPGDIGCVKRKIQQGDKSIKSYILTIMDKIKLPTG